MDTTFLTLGAFLIGIGFLLLLADLFLGSGVMFMLALGCILVGVVFVFKHSTPAGLYALGGVGIVLPGTTWLLLRLGPLRRLITVTQVADETVASMTSNQELEQLRGRFGKT